MRSQFLFSQVKTLHDSGLYDSADILNIICHGSPPPADLLSLYGSVLYKKKEFSRAASYFEKALSQTVTERHDARYREAAFGLSKCKLKESQLVASLNAMQRLQMSEMTPRMLKHLALLHRLANSPHSAARCYTEILRRNPLAIEAATALAELGSATPEVLMLSSQKVELVLDSFCQKHSLSSQTKGTPASDENVSSQQGKRTRRRSSSATATSGVSTSTKSSSAAKSAKSSSKSSTTSTSSSRSRLSRKPTTRSATAQQKEQKRGEPRTPQKIKQETRTATTPSRGAEQKEKALALAEAEAAHVKRFMELFITAHALAAKSKFAEAMPIWSELSKFYRRHLHVLQRAALCAWQQGNTSTARSTFEAIRAIDDGFIDGLDSYAEVLRQQGQLVKLNEFVMGAARMASPRHEAWAAMAIYCDVKGHKDMAKTYLSKGVASSRDKLVSGASLILRGQLQLQLQQGYAAIESFRKAQTFGKSINVYSGLVRACHSVAKHSEALYTAKEACIQMPNSAVALTLLALAYLKQKEPNRVQATKLVDRAFKMDSESMDVAMAKVQLHILDEKFEDAMALLNEQLKKKNRKVEHIYTRMAEVSIKMKKYPDAMIQYSAALNINPILERAVQGMALLEKLLSRLEEGEDDDNLGSEDDSLQELEDSYDDDDFDSFL